MKSRTFFSWVGALTVVGAMSAMPGAHAAQAPKMARLVVVQALPGQTLQVDLDGATVSEASATGEVLGPFSVVKGRHQVTFSTPSGDEVVSTSVDLDAGTASDLVVHLPAEATGKALATLYPTSTAPIAPGKSRVLIAHTASVAPADVRLDGAVVFRNIANGEFATADVAKGAHIAALLPAGLKTRPILGPLDVELAPATATMVYALGDARSDTMQVITHTLDLQSKGSSAQPTTISAGSAGLAAGIKVKPFAARHASERDAGMPAWPLLGTLAVVLALAWGAAGRARRRVAVDSSS